jgi:dolichol-phosphate mannosyltransferase
MNSTVPRCHIHFIIPLLNEAENVETLARSLRSLRSELSDVYDLSFIVVDDGSTDNTSGVLSKVGDGLDLTVLRHEVNRGPGIAFGTGFAYLADRLKAGDWVVTMEGDNTSRLELLRQMLTRTKEGYEVVLASPYMYGGGITNTSIFRTFLSYGANVFMKELLEIRGIMTMSSFFRLYSGATLSRMMERFGPSIIERAGFESMIELLMKMIYMQCTISEVPMVLDTSRRKGKSKMKLAKTIMGFLVLMSYKRRWIDAASRPASATSQISPISQFSK